jgi:hypothetical protein
MGLDAIDQRFQKSVRTAVLLKTSRSQSRMINGMISPIAVVDHLSASASFRCQSGRERCVALPLEHPKATVAVSPKRTLFIGCRQRAMRPNLHILPLA